METIGLANGVRMPLIGYGTYQTPPRRTREAVLAALRAGYRAVDTAQCYGNEREVGEAVRASGLPREEIFVTTKLWACRGYGDAVRSIDASLGRLGMEYVDLFLIHEPTGRVHEIWRALEEALRAGKARAIGISNFREDRYRDLLSSCHTRPMVNQMETHVFRQQKTLRAVEAACGTVHAGWSPLACGRHGIFTHPLLREAAAAHDATVSQVALRFLVQQHIPVIPKSLDSGHMAENLDLWRFTLTDEDMERLTALDEGKSLFGWW